MNPDSKIQSFGILAVGVALAAGLLSACGGSSKASSAQTTTTVVNAGARRFSGGGLPGASGTVAAIDASSMEVQNPQTGQVTVKWTPSTVFTKTVDMAASSITAGECVTVIGTTSGGHLTARSVMISQATAAGSCTGRFGPRRSGQGGFPTGSSPNFRARGSTPRSVPSALANLGLVNGKVTSVSGESMLVYGISSSGFARRGSAGSTPPTSVAATSITVGLSSSTTYSETQAAAAGDLAVNDCVTANGTSDSTGAITARSVRITSTGGHSCSGALPGGAAGSSNG